MIYYIHLCTPRLHIYVELYIYIYVCVPRLHERFFDHKYPPYGNEIRPVGCLSKFCPVSCCFVKFCLVLCHSGFTLCFQTWHAKKHYKDVSCQSRLSNKAAASCTNTLRSSKPTRATFWLQITQTHGLCCPSFRMVLSANVSVDSLHRSGGIKPRGPPYFIASSPTRPQHEQGGERTDVREDSASGGGDLSW